MKEYGELMSLLMYFRERYQSEDEFRQFVLTEVRAFVYDLRDFNIEISLSYQSSQSQRANTNYVNGK